MKQIDFISKEPFCMTSLTRILNSRVIGNVWSRLKGRPTHRIFVDQLMSEILTR